MIAVRPPHGRAAMKSSNEPRYLSVNVTSPSYRSRRVFPPPQAGISGSCESVLIVRIHEVKPSEELPVARLLRQELFRERLLLGRGDVLVGRVLERDVGDDQPPIEPLLERWILEVGVRLGAERVDVARLEDFGEEEDVFRVGPVKESIPLQLPGSFPPSSPPRLIDV